MLINAGEVTLNTQWLVATDFVDERKEKKGVATAMRLTLYIMPNNGPELAHLSFYGFQAYQLNLALKEVAEQEMAHALVDNEYGTALTAKTKLEVSTMRRIDKYANSSLNDEQ